MSENWSLVTSSPQARPWAAISPQIAEVLRPVLPRLAEEILEQVAGELPMLGRDLAGPYGVALKAGVEQALEHFLGLLGADRPALDERLRNLYESFGAREDKHGRTLEILLAAYRRGARGAWEHFSRAALDADVPTQDVVRLAEAIFAYIEELSHASAVGFAQEHSDRAGRRNLVRQQLGEVLLFEGAATAPARVAELAAEAGWAVPERVAALVLPTVAGAEGRRTPLLPDEILLAVSDTESLAIVSADALRRSSAALAKASRTGDESVYVGTVRALAEAPVSLAHARAVQRLVLEGVVPGAPVVSAQDHLTDLVLHADPRLLADLTADALAPLQGLSPGRREILAATLRVWLAAQGDRLAAAAELEVHPQTVSYRMSRLEDLSGPALRDPRRRLAIQLALAGRPR